MRPGELASRLTGGAVNGPMSLQEYATLGVEVALNTAKAVNQLGYSTVISVNEGMSELASNPL